VEEAIVKMVDITKAQISSEWQTIYEYYDGNYTRELKPSITYYNKVLMGIYEGLGVIKDIVNVAKEESLSDYDWAISRVKDMQQSMTALRSVLTLISKYKSPGDKVLPKNLQASEMGVNMCEQTRKSLYRDSFQVENHFTNLTQLLGELEVMDRVSTAMFVDSTASYGEGRNVSVSMEATPSGLSDDDDDDDDDDDRNQKLEL